MNRWVVGTTVVLGLIAGGCLFPEAEKVGGGGSGDGAAGTGGSGQGGGGGGAGLTGIVTIAQVGGVSCASGTSTQRHLIRTAAGDYFALFFDEAAEDEIQVKRSTNGMVTWEDADGLGLAPKLHEGQGADIGFDYAELPDGGVIHAAISVRDMDGYHYELHGRATVDESGLPSWETPQQMGNYALPVTDPPDGPATGITSVGIFDQTGLISPAGQGDYVIAFAPDTFASFSYTPLWEPYYLAFGGTATHARAVLPHANGALGIEDSNASPTEGQLKYWVADGGGVTRYETLTNVGNHLRFAWGAVASDEVVHVLRGLTSNGFEYVAIDADLNVGGGLSPPKNLALAPDAGVFLTAGPAPHRVVAFTITDDFSIQMATLDGSTWGSWVEVEPPSEQPRSCISGVATPDAEGRVALLWTEEEMSNFSLKGALVSP